MDKITDNYSVFWKRHIQQRGKGIISSKPIFIIAVEKTCPLLLLVLEILIKQKCLLMSFLKRSLQLQGNTLISLKLIFVTESSVNFQYPMKSLSKTFTNCLEF